MSSYKCCSPSSNEAKKVDSLASLLKIVAEPSRLKLLCVLRQGEHCVCEIMEHLTLSQSLISHHLRDLKDAGIVFDKKRGVRVYYALTKQGKSIATVLFKIIETEKQS